MTQENVKKEEITEDTVKTEKGLKNAVPPVPSIPDDEALSEPGYINADRDNPLWPIVRAAMKEIYDPEIPVNVYELGLIYGVKFLEQDGGLWDVDIKMTLTSPGCPVAQEMPGWIQSAIFPIENVGDVDVEIIWDPPWDPSKMSEAAKLQLNMFY